MESKRHNVKCIWLTGLSGSGKTTLANELKKNLDSLAIPSIILDGDILRKGLNRDLGFTERDREENIRRAADIAKIILQSDVMVICAFMSPTAKIRNIARSILGDYYTEVFVDTPLSVCMQRDVKGIYKKAQKGEIKNLSGVDTPFESPTNPQIIIRTENQSPRDGVQLLLDVILKN